MESKELSNPFSTGGGGPNFETRIQTSFAVLMLTNGVSPCLPHWPIEKIQLQGRHLGYETDDLVVYAKNEETNLTARLLCQVKHDISFTGGNKVLKETLSAAWRDFNNAKLFQKGRDAIALVSGPLKETDLQMRKVLELARSSVDGSNFEQKLSLGKFTSDKQREKAAVFRGLLAKANAGVALSDNQFWEFLKAFHILNYDLDIEFGVNIALLNSLIGQYDVQAVRAIWAQLLEKIQSLNQSAGMVTRATLPDDIVDAFSRKKVISIPGGMVRAALSTGYPSVSSLAYADVLAVAQLIGSWDEQNENDREIISTIAGESYGVWIVRLRQALADQSNVVSFKNGVWRILDRVEVWGALGNRLFNNHLEAFERIALTVLQEVDPKFELPAEERYVASVHGKVLRHSDAIRQGVADTLAILGSHSEALVRCTERNATFLADLLVEKVLVDADWRLWASLDRLLPSLAESSPKEFLKAVDVATNQRPSPFKKLFEEEGSGFMGGNYLTGLLWGIEALAWHPEYLSMATLLLGNLHVQDPGGQWSNRPLNSLVDIYLPWMPHTTASVQVQQAAIKALRKEAPEADWHLLLKLLPNQTRSTSGTYEPKWRNFAPESREKSATKNQYLEQVNFFANELVDIAEKHPEKIAELVSHFDSLPSSAFSRGVALLEMRADEGIDEGQRSQIWGELVSVVSKHRKYSHAIWSLPESSLEKLEAVADSLQPDAPEQRYLRLFTERDFELYSNTEDWRSEAKRLSEQRARAVAEVYDRSGVDGVVEFAETAEAPFKVGVALAEAVAVPTERDFIGQLLAASDDRQRRFVRGYLLRQYERAGVAWIESVGIGSWPKEQQAAFFVAIGFFEPVWQKAVEVLGESQNLYWRNVDANGYVDAGNFPYAIEKLLENGRPGIAVECLGGMLHRGKFADSDLLVRSLRALAASDDEVSSPLEGYHIVELVKQLQQREDVDSELKAQVEWVVLPVLESHEEVTPKFLELKLARNPDFYISVIQMIFRSNREQEKKSISESDQRRAANAYRLLFNWRTPPGITDEGKFDARQFRVWLDEVVRLSRVSGHLDVALLKCGEVLVHTPADESGLWIDRSVADALNEKEFEKMRRGYVTGVFNSRGAHWIDPSGKPEYELSEEYAQRAAEVELVGLPRFAETLREISEGYKHDGDRIVAEHKAEDE
ncbi:MAG: hypothetical protein RH982_13985 [Parvibaculum sp.]|uniref:hypothetical protein n=1 Tax=Parvibaculum sp. TaxID=2024848 RepID=UPI0032EC6C92